MKKVLTLLLAAVITLAGWALAAHNGGEGTRETTELLTNGKNLWKHISEINPYTKWDLWPGKTKFYEGSEPHGMLLTVYVSKGAKKVIDEKKGVFGEGDIIVKEAYKPDRTLRVITVMYKAKDYDPQAGDWFWVKYNPDGSVGAEGKVGSCIACHSVKADNDWVFISNIK